MMTRALAHWMVALGIGGVAAGCTEPKNAPGVDPETRTTATVVTWADGRPAFSIECDQPGSCQSRAIAMCRGSNYSVLKSDNMPTRGNATTVRGPASVVVRCNV
jgi:hypothetical protein